MGAFICKQPNGLYCRFSTMVDGITHYNLTAEDYLDLCAERARKEGLDVLQNHLVPFDEVKKRFSPDVGNSVEKMNRMLLEMGDTEQLNPSDYEY